jgi:hypothetical protein
MLVLQEGEKENFQSCELMRTAPSFFLKNLGYNTVKQQYLLPIETDHPLPLVLPTTFEEVLAAGGAHF